MTRDQQAGRKNNFKDLLVYGVVIVVLGLVQPFLWQVVNVRAKKLQEVRSQTRQVEEIRKKIRDVKTNYERQKRLLDQLTVVAPKDRESLQVIERVEKLAQSQQVNLEVVNIEEGIPLKADGTRQEASSGESVKDAAAVSRDSEALNIFPLVMSLEAQGRPAKLASFLEAVEHVQELTQVKKYSITILPVKKGDAGVNLYTYEMKLDVMFYLQK